jgi:hypothetical protein
LNKTRKPFHFFILLAIFLIATSGVAGAAIVTNQSSSLIFPNDPEQSTSLPQRIAQRKSALKLQLSAAQSQHIAQKCEVAQTGLQDINTKDKAAAQARSQTYSDLAKQLANTIDSLNRQKTNTASLTAAQTTFVRGINQYLTDYEAYKTALDDAVIMDCTADPAGFEASLQDARSLRTNLASDVAKIKSSVPALTQALDADKQLITQSIKANP